MKSLLRMFVPAMFALGFCRLSPAAPQESMPRRTASYSERTLELAAGIPIQEGGRVKPLSSFAGFTMLRMHGKRSLKTPDGETLAPMAWLLDVLFYPAQAADYPLFRIDDIQTVEAIGLKLDDKKKRDQCSFNELRPALAKLFELAREYGRKEEKARSTVEQQVFTLATNVDEYSRLQSHFNYARSPQDVSDTPELVELFGAGEVAFSQVVARLPRLVELQGQWRDDGSKSEASAALMRLVQSAAQMSDGSESLALIPPTAGVAEKEAWTTPFGLLMSAFESGDVAAPQTQLLESFESIALSIGDPPRFEQALATARERSAALAGARGEYEKIGLELTYYRADLIYRSLIVFILGFVCAASLWLAPRNKWLYRATASSLILATGLLIAAITMRCIIRDRPPVSTLYETMLFVAAVGSIILLVIEWINRQRIALSIGAVLGMIVLFLANGYETLDKRDTMPQLVAVLDTNFWLSTHVTCITAGYAAGLVAAFIANAYLITRLFGIRRGEATFAKSLARMTYGALCFGLIFSVVGTILGGIWANESWGRFWGWDPKENGALLICLTQLVILHGRMGGYLRDFGVAAMTAFQGTVIGFSWFGVNLLGVGLHSYGFTSGIHTALWSYYLLQWGLIAVCMTHYMLQRTRERAVEEALATRGGGPAIPTLQHRAD